MCVWRMEGEGGGCSGLICVQTKDFREIVSGGVTTLVLCRCLLSLLLEADCCWSLPVVTTFYLLLLLLFLLVIMPANREIVCVGGGPEHWCSVLAFYRFCW